LYITDESIREMERRYGVPDEVRREYEMTGREFDMVSRSRKHGRSHDVTLFIIDNDSIVVIKKPMYPPGAYRAPSGGIAPGEDFEAGALREAYEETGLHVAIEKYILRAFVRFTHQIDAIDWTTHVFSARPCGGALQPIDTHEIVEARLATVEELTGSIREVLLKTESTGLRYRAELGDIVLNRLIEMGAISKR
jgi:8-oxo-dGTP pyrophosphatase MutT (NUDIX family)